jgi:hypothetical protein
MRSFLFILLLALSGVAVAAQAPPPPRLEPLPEPPPQAIGFDQDATTERGVRLTPRADEIVEETVQDGKRSIRVRTPGGAEYMLIEDLGDGTHARQRSHDSGIRIPLWVIYSF